MKNRVLLIWLFAALSTTTSFAQLGVETAFNSAFTGNNQSFLFKYSLGKNKKSTFLIGPKIAINQPFFKNRVGPRKNLYAVSFKERIGLDFSYRIQLISNKQFRLNIFYNFQFSKSHRKFSEYRWVLESLPYESYSVPLEEQNKEDFIFIKHNAIYGPVLAFEHTLGIDFTLFLGEHFYISQRIGGGAVVFNELGNYYGPDDTWIEEDGYWYGYSFTGPNRLASSMISIGIGYNFKSNIKEN